MSGKSAMLTAGLIVVAFALGGWASRQWGSSLWGDADMPAGMAMGNGAAAGSGKKVLYWKSPMVPGEIHQEPGKDSMGMDLVAVYEGEGASAGEIEIDPTTRQNIGIRLGRVTTGPLVKNVRMVGYVAFDETTLGVVTTKIDGWIEKLYVDETGTQIHTGDPLFDLYSPELFSAQKEYLVALRSSRRGRGTAAPGSRLDANSLLSGAKTKLEYYDVPPETIEELARTGVASKTVTLRSPFTGIVTHKNVVDGEAVRAGRDLFRIADLSRVWVLGRVFEYDLPFVHVGDEARMTLSYIPGRTFVGRVTYIYPYLEEGTREISIRMEFFNPGYDLKPGMYSTIHVRSEIDPAATLVPDIAVIDTGERAVAFVARDGGRFALRDVRTGVRSENNMIQVISGLEPGEQVVLSGQFLLDSESRLREAALKFLEPGAASSADATSDSEAPAPPGTAPGTVPAPTRQYVCPMPEHQVIVYDAPGPCPICGDSMELVPTAGAQPTDRESAGDEPR